MFDEISGVVSRPSCGFKDERDQVDAGVSVELFLFFAFGQAAVMRLMLEGEWRYNGCINMSRDATQCYDNVHASQFCLAV